MTIGRSRQLAEQLDAILDGRLEAVPEELESLVAVAEELRAELGELELDPASAEAHLNLVYRRGRPSRIRRPQFDMGWRRRAVSIALAASLVGLPAAFASGRALPGDPLYALKLGIEKVRLVAALSPGAEAGTRTSIATVRLEELQGLLQAGEFGRVPDALMALQQAVLDAQQAIALARRDGADSSTIAALESRLTGLTNERDDTINRVLRQLPEPTRKSIIDVITHPPTTTIVAVETTPCDASRGAGDRCGTGGTDPPTTTIVVNTTEPPTTTTEPPTTTTEPPTTTEAPPTTTEAPTTTEPAGQALGDALRGLLP